MRSFEECVPRYGCFYPREGRAARLDARAKIRLTPVFGRYWVEHRVLVIEKLNLDYNLLLTGAFKTLMIKGRSVIRRTPTFFPERLNEARVS